MVAGSYLQIVSSISLLGVIFCNSNWLFVMLTVPGLFSSEFDIFILPILVLVLSYRDQDWLIGPNLVKI